MYLSSEVATPVNMLLLLPPESGLYPKGMLHRLDGSGSGMGTVRQ